MFKKTMITIRPNEKSLYIHCCTCNIIQFKYLNSIINIPLIFYDICYKLRIEYRLKTLYPVIIKYNEKTYK